MATRIEIARLKEAMPDSTMIYVTHDQVEAMTLASRIVVLADKGIAQVGTPLELYETPDNEFVAQFIGSPSMNLLSGVITQTGETTIVKLDSGGTAVSRIATDASDAGKHVNIGVRPEDFQPADRDPILEGIVDFTEALGEVTLLYFAAEDGADTVVAKLPGVQRNMRGQTVAVTAEPDKVHLFHQGISMRK